MTDPLKIDPESGELDFTEFHPQTHPFLSRECFRWYGGPARHAEYWYRYGFHYRPLDILYRLIGCAWGRHSLADGSGIELYCRHCDHVQPTEE